MTRLIDADALITAVLKNAIDYAVLFGDSEMHRLLVQVIAHQPTIDIEPQWIPVSERLPEVRQWVLCQCRAGIMDVLRLTADGSWDKNYPHTEYMSGFVVAWMPLPKPYEVKE